MAPIPPTASGRLVASASCTHQPACGRRLCPDPGAVQLAEMYLRDDLSCLSWLGCEGSHCCQRAGCCCLVLWYSSELAATSWALGPSASEMQPTSLSRRACHAVAAPAVLHRELHFRRFQGAMWAESSLLVLAEGEDLRK